MQNKNEFVRVIQENEALIYKVSKVYTNSREDEQDLYQEIVYQLWKSFGSFRHESKLSTWMYRIALNTAISNLNKEKRKGTFLPISDWALNRTETDDPVRGGETIRIIVCSYQGVKYGGKRDYPALSGREVI